ncbi:16S rRNA (uracil(1498)-N(3))-methyltransferase [Amnibacterium endophyticum]|uniref:Ribosomal RNA small subunit methyltransferase E n=1 Tax=Amnibacterium endophyticum TaxID=2109337 RepID=A0ABW4LF81_9MICO
MAHFYLATALSAEHAELTGEEARHAAQVARLRAGERVVVGDGRGRTADAEAVAVARDRVELRVLDLREEPEPSPRITLVQALAKGGRDEQAVQAAVELGVAAIVPWQATRSVSRWTGAKVESGRERWAAIAREAGKQAMRPWAAEVLPLRSTAEVAALPGLVVLEPGAPVRIADLPPGDATLVVGPEGGIAPEELAAFDAAGAARARLGPHVLRTSTAGPAALAALLAPRWP